MTRSDELIERLRKMARCIYIAVEETVADDISDALTKAANELEALTPGMTGINTGPGSGNTPEDQRRDVGGRTSNDEPTEAMIRRALIEARACIVKFAETPCQHDYAKHDALCMIDAAINAMRSVL